MMNELPVKILAEKKISVQVVGGPLTDSLMYIRSVSEADDLLIPLGNPEVIRFSFIYQCLVEPQTSVLEFYLGINEDDEQEIIRVLATAEYE